ncbi:DEAD/DEAH box helicase family protein [Candidatus Pacearchaeota archaeon]|nr:DEAD/DEAH box helicase family protein [Candidatus Pacearchaeota archaeon]
MKKSFLLQNISLECKNDACRYSYDNDELLYLINHYGVVHADCGDSIYQGFSCRRCNHTSLFPFGRNEPLVNLQDFILIPVHHSAQNLSEQIYEIEREEDLLSPLLIPAWDEKMLSIESIKKGASSNANSTRHLDVQPYVLSKGRLDQLCVEENETKEVKLRRFYPNTPDFRSLFTLLNPSRYTSLIEESLNSTYNPSLMDCWERWRAIQHFASSTEYGAIEQAVTERMLCLGYPKFSIDSFWRIHTEELPGHFKFDHISNELWDLTRFVDWESYISSWRGWESQYRNYIDKICEKLTLDKPRANLGQWLNEVEEGKALFIDAPMGLGKSTSIVNALSSNLELSAVIFFPTKELCQEITLRLKREIAYKLGRTDWCKGELDEDINYFRRDYLNSEVYMTEGINEAECDFYNDITNLYKNRWFKKREFCNECAKSKSCRFVGRNWIPEARKARIIVTTHQQYNLFNNSSQLYKRVIGEEEVINKKGKTTKKDITKVRDLFIVDEDLVLQQCYSPIRLNFKDLSDFSSAFSEFLSEQLEDNNEEEKILRKIDLLLGRICRPNKTALIAPIDLAFKIPQKIHEEWNKSYSDQMSYIPDYLESIDPAANILDILENGIKYGVVVQKYREVSEIYFPNPRVYDLSKCPPHIFFDGTNLSEKFLKKKLRGVKFKTLPIKVKPIWPVNVHQNINSDLSKSKIDKEMTSVEKLLGFIFYKEGKGKKYYIHTTKAIRDAYLNAFIENQNKRLDHPITINHYGNLRGSNEGQDCDVHIMLGSFIPSDAVEIAMSLEFLKRTLKGRRILSTRDKMWTFKGSNKIRIYKPEFNIVNIMSKALRHSEQRQALARTRCLFHSVDFYIFSKEPVNEYEPFLPTPKILEFGSAFIPPSKQPDDKYEEVRNAILDFLSPDKKACDMDIHRATGLHRATIKKYRKAMLEKDELEMVEGSKRMYKRKPSFMEELGI